MKKYIGIDLGTTYSCISQLDDLSDNPEVVLNNGGDMTTPSVVFINEDISVVGRAAKNKLKTYPDNTVELFKREMGTDTTWEIAGNKYDPVSLSAMVLKEVFKPLQQENVTDYSLVVTCPANYNNNQRRFVQEAAKQAGLNEPVMVNEPTAAALAYCSKNVQGVGNLLVFDLGGGTFDVTAVHYDTNNKIYKVLASDGKDKLGGKDWDLVIEDMIYDTASSSLNTPVEDLKNDVDVASEIKNQAERIKKELSLSDFNENIYLKGSVVDLDITVEEFEKRTEPLLMTAVDMIQTVLDIIEKNKDQYGDIGSLDMDRIILVGGSSKMPQVLKGIEEEYPQFAGKCQIFEADIAVCKGAAIYAKLGLQESDGTETTPEGEPAPGNGNNGPKMKIDEVLTVTLGTDMIDKDNNPVCRNVMFKNTPIPGRSERVTFRLSEGQTILPNKVYNNKVRDSSELVTELDACELVAEFDMKLPAPATANERIGVIFDVDANAILRFILDMRGELTEYEIPLDCLTMKSSEGKKIDG